MVITTVSVKELLGAFDHVIRFDASWEFVIIYGPNGVGKTKLLEAVTALLRLEIAQLRRIPFRELRVDFSDGSSLQAERTSDGQGELDFSAEFVPHDLNAPLVLTLSTEGTITVTSFSSSVPEPWDDWVVTRTTYRRVGSATWEDQADGEIVRQSDLEVRLAGQYQDYLQGETEAPQVLPFAIRDFCSKLEIHLIETQRLLRVPFSGLRGPSPVRGVPRPNRDRTEPTTVSHFSAELKRLLGRALAVNSRTTQRLDRTFPRRILETTTPPEVDDAMVRQKYADQNSIRTRLAEISLIGGEADLPLPSRDLEDWERHVLWTSLQDTDEKLSSYDAILDKVTLLEDIVNRRFLRKKIVVNADEGLTIVSKFSQEPLDPDGLSSGEQHELIMIYDLLFNVAPGSTVLIDEPEISLHVAWQQHFLQDISRISRLSSLRFVIATHSPQIIHKSWNRTVQLGPDFEGEDA